MPATDCPRIDFDHLNTRIVTSDFEGGRIASDGGVPSGAACVPAGFPAETNTCNW